MKGQFERLKPYLTPVRTQRAVLGQLRTKARVLARRGTAALAVDDTFATLMVGHSEGRSPLRNVERYASPETALRVFFSVPSMASNNRWRGPRRACGLAPRALRNCAPSARFGVVVRPLNFTVRRHLMRPPESYRAHLGSC
jgi:hypothetical protein